MVDFFSTEVQSPAHSHSFISRPYLLFGRMQSLKVNRECFYCNHTFFIFITIAFILFLFFIIIIIYLWLLFIYFNFNYLIFLLLLFFYIIIHLCIII